MMSLNPFVFQDPPCLIEKKKKAYRRHDDCGNQLLGIVVCDMVNKNINTDSREKKSTR